MATMFINIIYNTISVNLIQFKAYKLCVWLGWLVFKYVFTVELLSLLGLPVVSSHLSGTLIKYHWMNCNQHHVQFF